jgi:hypothetical protein
VSAGRELPSRPAERVTHVGNIETGRKPPTDLDELRGLTSLYHASPAV